MAKSELVAAKLETIAAELALRVNAAASEANSGALDPVQEVEVWLCDFAKQVRAGELD
jgi:hypothetical protein